MDRAGPSRHVDSLSLDPLVEPPPPSYALAGYRNAKVGVPVTAVLVVIEAEDRFDALLRELAADPLPVNVAVTTTSVLHTAVNAADQIWSVPGLDPVDRSRLIDLSR